MKKPVVLFTALREPTYVRVALALRSLQTCFSVNEITSNAPTYPGRLAHVLPRLATRSRGHDVCVAGFLGQPLAVWLRLWQRRPIVLDAFVSLYDTLCFDRRLAGTRSPVALTAYWLDRVSTAFAKVVVVDTNAHAEYFSKTFLIPKDKIETVYLGHDPTIFAPMRQEEPQGSVLQVFSYSSYLPVHGMEHVVRAAHLLRSERQIAFTLIGRGQTHSSVRRLANHLDLTNVRFVDWVPYERLPAAIASADVCLGGHFASTGKAQRTIAGKTFQFLAMGRSTIVGDSAANRELFVPGEHAVFCPQSNPEALAQSILSLARSPEIRHYLGCEGERMVRQRFNPEAVAERWASVVGRALV